MTSQSDTKITRSQFLFFIIQAQIGGQFVTLPYPIQPLAKGGAWISMLLGGLLSQVVILFICALCKRYKSGLYQMNKRILGRPLGFLLNSAYGIYFLISSSYNLLIYLYLSKIWLYIKTPRWFLLAMSLVVSIYLARSSLQVITRFIVLTSILLPLFILVIPIGMSIGNVTYPQPFLEAGWSHILMASFKTLISFAGFEAILVVYPYVEGTDKQKFSTALIANGVTTCIYIMLVYISTIVFSPSELLLIPEPLVYMMKSIRFSLLERPDLLFLNFAFASSIITSAINLYLSTKAFGRVNSKKAVPVIAIIAGLLTYIATDPTIYMEFEKTLNKLTFIFALVVPVLLWLISLVRRLIKHA